MSTSRVIVITGASRGLGRALVEWFAERGQRVVGCGRHRDAIRDLSWNHSAGHRFDVVDVADERAVESWASSVLESHGAPDLLIANAAVAHDPAPLWEIPAATFDLVTAVNLNGVANTVRHFVPAMVVRDRGVIALMSSGWGRSTAAGVAPYCATKWGIEGLARALAQDLPPGCAAVAVNPGIVHTDMLQQTFGEQAAAFEAPERWAERAGPYLFALDRSANGTSGSVPGA